MNLRKSYKLSLQAALLASAMLPASLLFITPEAIGQAAPASSPTSDAAAKTTSAIKNIVLVHGAWADGSSWSKIVPLLEAKGFHVVCVQNPLSSIADDVATTNRIIDAQDGPVLLVGHSYGGTVITEAGMNPKVKGLVYVAAFAPDKGETMAGLAKPYGDAPVGAEVRPIEGGYLVLTEKGVAEDFAQDLTVAEKAVTLATQGPLQSTIFGTTITDAAWHTKPSWFVVAANDRSIQPEQERFTAKRMGAKTLTLESSHVAMLAKPNEVSNFIAEAATDTKTLQAAK